MQKYLLILKNDLKGIVRSFTNLNWKQKIYTCAFFAIIYVIIHNIYASIANEVEIRRIRRNIDDYIVSEEDDLFEEE